jgi:hypothetical protein
VTGEVYTGFWWKDPREGDHWKDLGIYGRIILKWIFKEWDGKALSGLFWLKKGRCDGRT